MIFVFVFIKMVEVIKEFYCLWRKTKQNLHFLVFVVNEPLITVPKRPHSIKHNGTTNLFWIWWRMRKHGLRQSVEVVIKDDDSFREIDVYLCGTMNTTSWVKSITTVWFTVKRHLLHGTFPNIKGLSFCDIFCSH